MFFRDGDLGLTVRRLAAEGATTSQTIYTYFGSRDAVVDAMYARALADIDALIATCESKADSDEVLHVVVPYRTHALARPGQFRMMSLGRSPSGTDPGSLASRRKRLVSAFAEPGPGVVPAEVLLAAVNGFIDAELHAVLEGIGPSDEVFHAFVGALGRTS